MAKKAKNSKKKQVKATPSTKITKPTKPQQTTPPPVVQVEQPTVSAAPAPAVEQAVEAPLPEPVQQPVPEAPQPTPQPAMLVATSRKTIAGSKVLAQIGRHIVHSSHNIADELVITDMTTGKPIANIHENVPLPVIRWIVECAEFIQDNPKMDDIVKRHGMTNVKAFCGYATGLELSKYQAPPKDTVRAVVM
jgi:hypothetical protein